MDSFDRHFLYRGNKISAPPLSSGLYIVATPIGNLGDITLRALETLAASAVIACEDTRTSGILLKHFAIDRPKVSYNEHNAASRGPDLLRQIGEGAAVSLISDAVTPLVSDPGFRLVEEAAELGYKIMKLTGTSALLAALVASAVANEENRICGFLPNKQRARLGWLAQLSDEECTLIFFESPNRVRACLRDMISQFGADRRAVVARELTKIHETFYRGSLSSLAEQFSDMERVRGEIVVIVQGAQPKSMTDRDVCGLLRTALGDMKTKQAAAHIAKLSGRSTQELYRMALKIKDEA